MKKHGQLTEIDQLIYDLMPSKGTPMEVIWLQAVYGFSPMECAIFFDFHRLWQKDLEEEAREKLFKEHADSIKGALRKTFPGK